MKRIILSGGGTGGHIYPAVAVAMKDEDGNAMESCPHPKQKVFVKLSVLPEEFDLIRQKAEE